MMNDQDRQFIREIVSETIRELKRTGLLKSVSDLAYVEVSELLKGYYDDGERDRTITDALTAIRDDSYFKIIPLYFSYGYTIERIAEVFDVEISTITRNKKRLCLDVWARIQ